MHVSDEYVPVLGRSMTIRRPDGPTRGGVVALHGATSPVWRRASPADLTVETVARCGHLPSPDGGQRRSDIASAYGDVLAAWF
jgi:hypothetical protein